MNQKDTERWLCENTGVAYWNKYEGMAAPLGDCYNVKPKSLMDESKETTTILHSMDSSDGGQHNQ